MKKLLLALIAFITVAVAAPVAQAGQYARVYTNRGPVYLHKSQLYGGGNYYNSNYHNRYSHRRSNHHRSYRSHRSYYSRPVYYSRPSYNYYRPNCGYRSSGYRSSPRFAVSFGF